MKVFAECFNSPDGRTYRRKTLLQFGKSSNLIGSAVLINPGSAQPIDKVDSNVIQEFYKKNFNEKVSNIDDWQTFNKDSTMDQIEKIFRGWYINQNRELNGVIQLFNCFYDIDQHLDSALENFNPHSGYIFNEYEYLKNKPVYFGWGNAGKFGKINQIATDVFKEYISKHTEHIYDSNFAENCFYHPGYINRSFKHNIKSKEFAAKFYLWLKGDIKEIDTKYLDYIPEEFAEPKAYNIQELKRYFDEQFDIIPQASNDKTSRYKFDDIYELTITKIEGGYWGIRTLNPKNRENAGKFGGWKSREFFKNYYLDNEKLLFDTIIDEAHGMLLSQNS